MWYEMTIQKDLGSPGLGADVHIAATSPWFRGHFPDRPVLPGIAQLSMVFDLIQKGFNHSVSLTEISRVRFKQLIVPDDRIRIEAVPKTDKQDVYVFRIFKDSELISNGTFRVTNRADTAGAPEP